MMPGALLLGNAGDAFTCGHEHGKGDRCIAFSYSDAFRERVVCSAGISRSRFRTPRLAPIRTLSSLVARASELLNGGEPGAFEALGILALGQAIQIENRDAQPNNKVEPSSLARVTRVIRIIENDPDLPHDLAGLAQIARLSPYHFVRIFERITGTTPYQYLLRMRLRRVAVRLRSEPARILDLALDCGFGDVSNFNRVFRAEFGVSPRLYRVKAWHSLHPMIGASR